MEELKKIEQQKMLAWADIFEYAAMHLRNACKEVEAQKVEKAAKEPAPAAVEEKKEAPEPKPEPKRGRKAAPQAKEEVPAPKPEPKKEKPTEKKKGAPAPVSEDGWTNEPTPEPKKSLYSGKTAVELYKLCRQRGIAVEIQKPAKYYADVLEKDDQQTEAEEEDWTLE